MAMLNERITKALTSGISSEAASALIADVEVAIEVSSVTLNELEGKALDPLTREADVEKLQAEVTRLTLEGKRLGVALERLRTVRDAAREGEEQAKRLRVYREAEKARDALSKELVTVYNEAAKRIADVLAKVDDNDELVARANRTVPAGCEALLPAVGHALGRGEHLPAGPQNWLPKRFLDRVKLPSLQADAAPLWDRDEGREAEARRSRRIQDQFASPRLVAGG